MDKWKINWLSHFTHNLSSKKTYCLECFKVLQYQSQLRCNAVPQLYRFVYFPNSYIIRKQQKKMAHVKYKLRTCFKNSRKRVHNMQEIMEKKQHKCKNNYGNKDLYAIF